MQSSIRFWLKSEVGSRKSEVGSRKSEVGFDGCETKCAGSGFIRKKLVSSRSKALMVHLYHIFSGWVSVLISCIQAAKPYVDSEPFSWWFTQQRLPMAAETMALLIARQEPKEPPPSHKRRRWDAAMGPALPVRNRRRTICEPVLCPFCGIDKLGPDSGQCKCRK